MPLGNVIVGLPEKSNGAVKRKMRNSTFGSCPYSAMRDRLGTGTGMVGISRRSTSSNKAFSAPEKARRR